MAGPDRYKPSNGPVIPVQAYQAVSWKRGDLVLRRTDGYATVATDASGIDCCLGVAAEDCDNSAGASGALNVEVDMGGAFIRATHTAGSLAITDSGITVYADGANAVDSYAGVTNKTAVGKIIAVPGAADVWVECFRPSFAHIHALMSALAASASTNPSEAQYNTFLAIWH